MNLLLAHARVNAPLRRLFPRRAVRRSVQGVDLWMPWSHRLPDYAVLSPAYGQNLVEMAALLQARDESEILSFLDVGANIGDSTRQILARVPARALAVEADPHYLTYLRRNLSDLPGATIVEALLTTASNDTRSWAPERRGGTTHFVESTEAAGGSGAMPSLPIAHLVRDYPDFADMRLIKSDTDGYDTQLIPELAAAYASSRPVLFFEYDPALTASVAHVDAAKVWDDLAQLGYDQVGFWDNQGRALGSGPCTSAADATRALLQSAEPKVDYLDVCVVHGDDRVAREALATLIGDVSLPTSSATSSTPGSGEKNA
jgi:FkbM family methyltransferase